MAAPALAGLIIDFFYTGSTSLGTLFPEVFAREVPKSVVCFAATAVSVPVYCSGILIWYFTVTSCHRRIRYHRNLARPPIRVHHLFKSFHAPDGNASQNRRQSQTCSNDADAQNELGDNQEVRIYIILTKLHINQL